MFANRRTRAPASDANRFTLDSSLQRMLNHCLSRSTGSATSRLVRANSRRSLMFFLESRGTFLADLLFKLDPRSLLLIVRALIGTSIMDFSLVGLRKGLTFTFRPISRSVESVVFFGLPLFCSAGVGLSALWTKVFDFPTSVAISLRDFPSDLRFLTMRLSSGVQGLPFAIFENSNFEERCCQLQETTENDRALIESDRSEVWNVLSSSGT